MSWLDIMAIHAVCPEARFVSKADVQGWPLVNRLVVAAGMLYLRRESRRDALRVVHQMADALRCGDTVAVFPRARRAQAPSRCPFQRQLLAGGHRNCHASAAGGTAFCRCASRAQPGGAVRRRHHPGAEPVAAGPRPRPGGAPAGAAVDGQRARRPPSAGDPSAGHDRPGPACRVVCMKPAGPLRRRPVACPRCAP